MAYDLKSLSLPKLYGRMLTIFAGVVRNPLTRPLLIGSLLENGGIPKLRKIKFTEEPSFFPLVIPGKHAADHMQMPENVLTNNRTSREQMPYSIVSDYALA